MKSRAMFAFLTALISTTSLAAQDLSKCKFSVYKVEAKSLGAEILTPERIISVKRYPTEMPGEIAWQVDLTHSGAAINKKFSSNNIGQQIAIFCDGREVARPTIASSSGATFVFTVAK